ELLKALKRHSRPPVRILVSRSCDNKDRAYLCLAQLYGADATLTQPLQNGALGWHVRNGATERRQTVVKTQRDASVANSKENSKRLWRRPHHIQGEHQRGCS